MADTTKIRIAIVEDDLDLQQSTEEYLMASGYLVWSVVSAEDFYRQLVLNPVDIVVLDLGLPGEDGLSVVRHLHALPQIRVIIVSAHDEVSERINALHAGADRYLVKPVDLSELVANIEACNLSMKTNVFVQPGQRKVDTTVSLQQQENTATAPAWYLNTVNWKLIDPDNNSIDLTSNEFLLLNIFLKARGNLVKKTAISKEIYDTNVTNSKERLDLLLTRLRKKCALKSGHSLPLKTIRNVGYIFSAPLYIE